MPFLDLFRNKQKRLGEKVVKVHAAVFVAAVDSMFALNTALEDHWNIDVELPILFTVNCEWYYFYAHLMDWYAFQAMGVKGQDILVDRTVEFGIVPLVRGEIPNGDDDTWEPLIAELLGTLNRRQIEYAAAKTVFVDNFDAVLAQGGVPGVNDAFADQPTAKVSRLFQRINATLIEGVQDFETPSGKVKETAEIWGMSLSGASSSDLFLRIQTIAMQELGRSRLLEGIRGIGPLIN